MSDDVDIGIDGLSKLIDRMQAPLTKQVKQAYMAMVEAEENWVAAIGCETWRPEGVLRRTLCLVPPRHQLPSMDAMLSTRKTFLDTVIIHDFRAGKQSTAAPQWILPNGMHQPVTKPLPPLPGTVSEVRHSLARAFRSGRLEEEAIEAYLDQKIRRQEEIVAGYHKRRQYEDGAEAQARLEEARLAVAKARRRMTARLAPFVGRLTSGKASNYTALWTHQPGRTKFSLQHVALIPVAGSIGAEIVREASARPGRTSDWGEPVAECLGIAIYSLANSDD